MRLALTIAAIISAGIIVAAGNRYEIVAAPGGAQPMAWRIDRWTGTTSLCQYYSGTYNTACH